MRKHTLQKCPTIAVHFLFAFGLCTPFVAQAKPSFPNAIPNGKGIDGRGCINCHTRAGGGGARNPFGADVKETLGAAPDWSALCPLDSDEDGQTNGQELGDPGCVWTRDATPARGRAISNPGDASSTSTDPTGVDDVVVVDGGTVGDGGSAEDDAGAGSSSDGGDGNEPEPPVGCSHAGRPGAGAPIGLYAALLAFVVALGRRRH